jgi:hypothetical protein
MVSEKLALFPLLWPAEIVLLDTPKHKGRVILPKRSGWLLPIPKPCLSALHHCAQVEPKPLHVFVGHPMGSVDCWLC